MSAFWYIHSKPGYISPMPQRLQYTLFSVKCYVICVDILSVYMYGTGKHTLQMPYTFRNFVVTIFLPLFSVKGKMSQHVAIIARFLYVNIYVNVSFVHKYICTFIVCYITTWLYIYRLYKKTSEIYQEVTSISIRSRF